MGSDDTVLTTNVRLSETYDQIGILLRDRRLMTLGNAAV